MPGWPGLGLVAMRVAAWGQAVTPLGVVGWDAQAVVASVRARAVRLMATLMRRGENLGMGHLSWDYERLGGGEFNPGCRAKSANDGIVKRV